MKQNLITQVCYNIRVMLTCLALFGFITHYPQYLKHVRTHTHTRTSAANMKCTLSVVNIGKCAGFKNVLKYRHRLLQQFVNINTLSEF